MKFDNQLRYAVNIVTAYKGDIPLHAWLKDFFREHKQMGSRDRKLVSSMVYGFYRLGHAVKNIPAEERILAALFLCNESPNELLQYFKPDWDAQAGQPLEEKITVYRQSNPNFEPTDIFPWKDELSEGIDHRAFCLSFLRQPDLFLRIRPGFQDEVLQKLEKHFGQPAGTLAAQHHAIQQPGITPDQRPFPDPSSQSLPPHPACGFIPPFTVRLPNGFKVEELFTPDKEVVIQDYSSQRIAPFLQPPPDPRPLSIWDACAASGGKSILAYDLDPQIDLTVSDIRESILHNLRQRFRQAGITKYQSFSADLTVPGPVPFPTSDSTRQTSSGHSTPSRTNPGSKSTDRSLQPGTPPPATLQLGTPPSFDLIIVDAPCSGSGTWSRTPEELYFFHPRKIGHYRELQQKITKGLAPYLAKGGSLVYITCSVFKRENEGVAELIKELLHPGRIAIIKGYELRADSMFAARFIGL